jgi:hypothetical protein
MPADPAFASLVALGARDQRHFYGSLADHLAGTRAILESWGNGRDVCIAGLFHAVYSTDGYRNALVPISQRSTVTEIIGADSELVVYRYAATDRATFYREVMEERRPILRDRFTGESTVLDSATLSALCELTLANEIEIERKSPGHVTRFGDALAKLFASPGFDQYLSPPARTACEELVPLLPGHPAESGPRFRQKCHPRREYLWFRASR